MGEVGRRGRSSRVSSCAFVHIFRTSIRIQSQLCFCINNDCGSCMQSNDMPGRTPLCQIAMHLWTQPAECLCQTVQNPTTTQSFTLHT